MPTENRSSNTEQMVRVPRELVERINRMYLDGMSVFGECEELRALLAQPAAQHQGEPIMLTAVAELVEDGDGGLEPLWILEGGTAELFAGMTLLVAENAPRLCLEDGSAEVYTHPDTGESDDLLAATSLEYGERMEALEKERDTLRAQLAKQAALLREANGLLKVSAERLPRKHQTIRAHIDHLRSAVEAALSASAEPSGPECKDGGMCEGSPHKCDSCDPSAPVDRDERAAIEIVAQAIYETWSDKPGYVEWVPGGNSLKQGEARQQARAALERRP